VLGGDREADPAHPSITPAGRRRLHRLDAVVACAQDALPEGLTERDRAQLVRLLGRLLTGGS
jgi:DNA-binding MarR family transcriptional regulator